MASKHGICCVEACLCPGCNEPFVAWHLHHEVLICPACAHRTPSRSPRPAGKNEITVDDILDAIFKKCGQEVKSMVFAEAMKIAEER